jgi:peptidoglycan-associated lipoprotein
MTMTEQSVFTSYRRISLILICMLLGACATTQRSSSGAGEQAAAPVSEAAKPAEAQQQQPAAAAEMPAAPIAATKPDEKIAVFPEDANAGADQGMPRSGASDEAAELKSQLADQDAQISKLREEQKADAERIDMAEQQKAAQAEAQQQAAAAEMPAAPVAATKPDEKIAAFPQDVNAGARAGEAAPQSTAASPVERSVYFAFDQSKIAEKYDDMLMANAAWLKAHPQMKAEVQGNCDERGSREYNLALGSRRAHAVKRALEVAGADGTRIATVSFGAEKPVAPGKDEASYSRNRRADIVY